MRLRGVLPLSNHNFVKPDLVIVNQLSAVLANPDRIIVTTACASLIRTFPRKAKRQKKATRPSESAEIAKLRKELARLERVPENEVTRFQIESEIYKLERADRRRLAGRNRGLKEFENLESKRRVRLAPSRRLFLGGARKR